MKNKKFELVILFLRIFTIMFVGVYSARIITALIIDALVTRTDYDFSKNTGILFSFVFSLTWALINTPGYRKVEMELFAEEYGDKDLLKHVKMIFSSMRLKLEKENSNEVVFKSSFFRTLWREKVTIRIKADSLELSGAVYYLEEVADRLKK